VIETGGALGTASSRVGVVTWGQWETLPRQSTASLYRKRGLSTRTFCAPFGGSSRASAESRAWFGAVKARHLPDPGESKHDKLG
jgi:hypothetical protein